MSSDGSGFGKFSALSGRARFLAHDRGILDPVIEFGQLGLKLFEPVLQKGSLGRRVTAARGAIAAAQCAATLAELAPQATTQTGTALAPQAAQTAAGQTAALAPQATTTLTAQTPAQAATQTTALAAQAAALTKPAAQTAARGLGIGLTHSAGAKRIIPFHIGMAQAFRLGRCAKGGARLPKAFPAGVCV